MMNGSKANRVFISSALAVLGIEAGAKDFHSVYKKDFNAQSAERIMIMMRPSVYGGPENLVTLNLYGKVLDAETKEPLSGVLVRLYMNENYLLQQVKTDQLGNFYFDKMDVWEGIEEKKYQIVLGEWFEDPPLARRTIVFGDGEVQKEEIFFISSAGGNGANK